MIDQKRDRTVDAIDSHLCGRRPVVQIRLPLERKCGPQLFHDQCFRRRLGSDGLGTKRDVEHGCLFAGY